MVFTSFFLFVFVGARLRLFSYSAKFIFVVWEFGGTEKEGAAAGGRSRDGDEAK